MKRFTAITVTALLGAVVLLVPALESVSAAALRQFDLRPQGMDDVIAMTGGKGEARYYFKYRLANVAGEAATPRVKIVLTTDTGKRYVDHYDTAVMRVLQQADASNQPPDTAAHMRREAMPADGHSEAVAVFGAIDPNADDLQVRVYGLWNSIVRDRKGRKFLERRVLVLDYSRSGDEYERHRDPIRLVDTSVEVEGDLIEIPRARDQVSD